MELKDVDRYEFYAGFLKSSAKITLIPKPLRRSGLQSRSTTVAPNSRHSTPTPNSEGGYRPPTESQNVTAATWVCKICSFSNPVPANFDATTANAHTPLPPCLACGIRPTLQHVLKAAISNASKRSVAPPQAPPPASERTTDAGHPTNEYFGQSTMRRSNEPLQCPRCTFSNHPSLMSCEMCGASLVSKSGPVFATTPALDNDRTESPGPMLDKKAASGPISLEALDGVKISFRGGGEKIFYERLKGSMTQRKWLLHNAPPPPKGRPRDGSLSGAEADTGVSERRTKTAGIAGLEQLGLSRHKNNELLIGSAFEDLEALMASAKEVIALAEKFSLQKGSGNGSFSAEENAILAESASQLGLVTTKDMVGGSGGSESLYLSELARNLAEFLTDDTRSVLKKAGGILTLVDLWAMFNRARGGVELVSPLDFEKAARLWESLKMPVRLRTFRSGVMVVQGRDRTDETTIKTLLSWLQDLHEFPPEPDVLWDWRAFGRGVTAQEAAERFGWSLGVAEEELLMAEEHGAVCREEGLEGLKFWKNYIGSEPIDDSEAEDPIIARLRSAALI
ncbi:EAP30 family protein [Akanthomyces lecanii RCEF 1005]|uniref:Vacuolar protein-sorting-associated protein 36 n=1 Tax=Akanthomyces lecanii RCEF 1005 TaxID=1081108 RepID=A0A168GWW9_CORDF|nr:EAP30 family protein [Akanthomyces lecanii RCEF 1005]